MYLDIIFLKRIESKLDCIIRSLNQQEEREEEMTQEVQSLITEVQNAEGLEQSALTLIHGLAAKLDGAAGDATAVKAIADSLRASDSALLAAIQATPDPSVTPAPTPVPDPSDSSTPADSGNTVSGT